MLNIWQHALGVNISYSFLTITGGPACLPLSEFHFLLSGICTKQKEEVSSWKKTLHCSFLHCPQSGNKQKASVFKIAVAIVLHAFLIPILDCSNLFCGSQLWGPAGAEQRPHKPFEMWEGHAVPCELCRLHICFQMESSWCGLKGPVLHKFWFP